MEEAVNLFGSSASFKLSVLLLPNDTKVNTINTWESLEKTMAMVNQCDYLLWFRRVKVICELVTKFTHDDLKCIKATYEIVDNK